MDELEVNKEMFPRQTPSNKKIYDEYVKTTGVKRGYSLLEAIGWRRHSPESESAPSDTMHASEDVFKLCVDATRGKLDVEKVTTAMFY